MRLNSSARILFSRHILYILNFFKNYTHRAGTQGRHSTSSRHRGGSTQAPDGGQGSSAGGHSRAGNAQTAHTGEGSREAQGTAHRRTHRGRQGTCTGGQNYFEKNEPISTYTLL